MTVLKNGTTQAIVDAAGVSATASVVVASDVATVTLPATNAIVANGQTLTVTGGTVSLAVAKGVITATYTASS